MISRGGHRDPQDLKSVESWSVDLVAHPQDLKSVESWRLRVGLVALMYNPDYRILDTGYKIILYRT